jgi:predicted lipid carrier protein YhbT
MDPIDTLLTLALRLGPEAARTRLLAGLCNQVLRGQTMEARLIELEGRSVCLHLTNVPCSFYFRVRRGRLTAATHGRADATIHVTIPDARRLAWRLEDPDTLFFHRRLCIEGDTETALHVKNLIDAFDFDAEAYWREVLGTPLGELVATLCRSAQNDRRASVAPGPKKPDC